MFSEAIFDHFLMPLWRIVGPNIWFLGPLAAIVIFALWSVRYIAKGGGQVGIIEGYVGTIGAGKTTLAVQHAIKLALVRNAVLLSNIPVICGPACVGDTRPDGTREAWYTTTVERRGRFPHVRKVTEVLRLPTEHRFEHSTLPMNDEGLDVGALAVQAFALRDQQRGLVLLMDEVGVIMPSRLWKDFSVALMWVLQQSRKLACEWIWTAQDPTFVDHQLRSLTAAVHYVRAMPPPSIWRRYKGKRPWGMIVSVYTPSNAPRANNEGGRADKRMSRRLVRYKREWEGAFDTDGVVLPSKHLKGAETLVAAVKATQDAHVVAFDAGPLAHGDDPDEAPEVHPPRVHPRSAGAHVVGPVERLRNASTSRP